MPSCLTTAPISHWLRPSGRDWRNLAYPAGWTNGISFRVIAGSPPLKRRLANATPVSFFFGPHGLGPWHNEEMRLALQRRINSRERKLRVLPVILPGGQRAKESELPGFLQGTTWVEFRRSLAFL